LNGDGGERIGLTGLVGVRCRAVCPAVRSAMFVLALVAGIC
jgi:hypothetical protein